MLLTNKLAVVTGGGSGIGLAIAESLAGAGARVVICGRGAERLERAAANSPHADQLIARPLDVADRTSVGEFFDGTSDELGPVDILVNSAGVNVPDRALSLLTLDDWDFMLSVNASGTFHCMHAVIPAMRARRDGVIINICSIAGKRGDLRGGAGYSAAKFAQAGLGMTVGAEVAEESVRVTTIYPGETNTPILDKRPVPLSAEHRASILQPEDVAAAALMVACLPPRAHVPELVITPTWQPFV